MSEAATHAAGETEDGRTIRALGGLLLSRAAVHPVLRSAEWRERGETGPTERRGNADRDVVNEKSTNARAEESPYAHTFAFRCTKCV